MSMSSSTEGWRRERCCNGKSYCFFCPVCYRPLGVPAGVNVPRVELPLQGSADLARVAFTAQTRNW